MKTMYMINNKSKKGKKGKIQHHTGKKIKKIFFVSVNRDRLV